MNEELRNHNAQKEAQKAALSEQIEEVLTENKNRIMAIQEKINEAKKEGL